MLVLVRRLLAASLLCSALAVHSSPVGSELQINTYSTGSQEHVALAARPDGTFLALFSSQGSDGSDTDQASIQGQRLASDGAPMGGSFQVNAYTTSDQQWPAVALRPGGGFIAVWQSQGSVGSDNLGTSIAGRLFGADGLPETAEFQINSLTVDDQEWAAVAAGADGDFVVVWESNDPGADGEFSGVRGQRFASDGGFLGAEFQVNTGTLGDQKEPSVGVDADGGFLVTWHGIRDSGGDTVWARRFESDGSAIGGDFEVALPGMTSYAAQSAVSVEPDGGFVVAWADYSMFTPADGIIKGRRYDSTGTPDADPFDISPVTTAIKARPAIARGADGGFLVTWQSSQDETGDDSDSTSIQARQLGAAGEPLGLPSQVNTLGTGSQNVPDVAIGPGGLALVGWQSAVSSGGDSSGTSIQGQIFRVEVPLFADGFESGDTSRWAEPES